MIHEVIKLAIEKGGYPSIVTPEYYFDTAAGLLERKSLFLDPTFWQALGKALGWSEWEHWVGYKTPMPEWQYQWHELINHLAEGKSADEFFADLLTRKEGYEET